MGSRFNGHVLKLAEIGDIWSFKVISFKELGTVQDSLGVIPDPSIENCQQSIEEEFTWYA